MHFYGGFGGCSEYFTAYNSNVAVFVNAKPMFGLQKSLISSALCQEGKSVSVCGNGL